MKTIIPKKLKGIVIGRAQPGSKMTIDKWKSILETKEILKDIPILIDADFGHTTPIFTFPIGDHVKINNYRIIIENKK